MEQYIKAIDTYKQAIRINPDYVNAHCNLGFCYGALGNYIEAIGAYKQAIRIKPDFAFAHYNLGLCYVVERQKGDALDEYSILKDLDKELANKLFNRIYE